MDCTMSSASPLRTSPTMIRSGRIRSEALNKSRIVQRPAAVGVGLLRFEIQAMFLREPEFGAVLDDHDAFLFGNRGGERIEEGGFARARAAGDDDVLPQPDAEFQKLPGGFGQAAHPHEILQPQDVAEEFADRQIRAPAGARRNDGMHPRAVREPGIEHRPVRINLPPHVLGHIMHRREERILAGKPGIRFLQPALAFDINLIEPVDHHLGHGVIMQIGRNRTQEKVQTRRKDFLTRHQAFSPSCDQPERARVRFSREPGLAPCG